MAKATQEAITLDKTAPITQYVNSYVSDFPLPKQQLIRDKVAEIAAGQLTIVQGRLTIGRCLNDLVIALGTKDFNQCCKLVLSRMGLSQRTCYRLYAGHKMVHGQFGPVAPYVLALSDGGNNITTTNQETGAIALTREAKTVLDKMPKISPTAPDEEKEKWARAYTVSVSKAGRTSVAKSPLDLVEERITGLWDKFEDIIERANKLKGAKERNVALDSLKTTIESMVAEHGKLAKTINAVPVAAPAESAPKVARRKAAPAAPAVAA